LQQKVIGDSLTFLNKKSCDMEINGISWGEILVEELKKPYMKALTLFLEKERSSDIAIYPPSDEVFRAFSLTPYEKVQVVIMGQDPYHGANQANGLSFSVSHGMKIPPSLKNIFKELQKDMEIFALQHGDLTSWAEQGVLLLNATLTVREGQPKSHYGMGWELFTDYIINRLADRSDPIIFVLWGKSAQEKFHHITSAIKNSNHFILTAPHPSPFSARRGFFGCHHFSKINSLLAQQGKSPIDYKLTF
jgi:uracil-DNA glycosylase